MNFWDMLKYYDSRMLIYKIELNIFIFRHFFIAFYCYLDFFFLSEFALPRLELTDVYASCLYK